MLFVAVFGKIMNKGRMHYLKLIDKFLNSYQSFPSTIFYVIPLTSIISRDIHADCLIAINFQKSFTIA